MKNKYIHLCDCGSSVTRDPEFPEDLSEWTCHDAIACLALNLAIVGALFEAAERAADKARTDGYYDGYSEGRSVGYWDGYDTATGTNFDF